MGYLPWIVGVIVGTIVYRLTDSGWAGFLFGLGLFLTALYATDRYQRHRPQKAARRQPPPTTTHQAYPPDTGPLAFQHQAISTSPGQIDLAGLNDALTGEPLDIASDLYQCQHCQVYYYPDSVDFLRERNDGKCVACTSTSIVPVREIGFSKRGRNCEPELVTLADYQRFANQVVTFQGYVPRINRSKDGKHYAVMFENKPWTAGLRMVVFAHCIQDVGGEHFLDSLLGKTIRVRGLLLHGAYGYEIIVNKRSMILEVK